MPLQQRLPREQRQFMSLWGDNFSKYRTLCRLRPSLWDVETAGPDLHPVLDQIRRDCTRIVLQLARIPKW